MTASPVNWANSITLLRFLATPVFIGVLVKHREAFETGAPPDTLSLYRYIALGVFSVAAASDALDGFIARHFNQKTELGTIMDPLADKLLLIAAVLTLSLPFGLGAYRLPFWFPLLVLTRDLIIVVGIIIIFMMRAHVHIRPSYTGKATTFFQMAVIVSVLLHVPVMLLDGLVLVTTILTAVSGIQYISRGFMLLHDTARAHGEDS